VTLKGRTGESRGERDLVTFVDAHYPRLIRLAALVCRNPSEAEDAVQAALEQAWRHRDTIHDPAKVRPWLDRIVVREAIRLDRRPSLFGRWLSGPREIDVVPEIADGRGVSPASTVAVRMAYESLPAAQRAVVALHLYAGYSVAETAEIVGAPLETTRSRLRLAREHLRDELGEDTP
jgi:RNA polymerase sigma-70 factor, ECF subfamily